MAELLINRTKRLKNQQFYSEIKPKKTIFLHHTGGTTADGAISWWNQTPEPVGTPYVIDRDGTIYETFDPHAWAWSLGIGNRVLEQQSIPIEIVSAGFILPVKDKFYFYPLYPNLQSPREIPKEEVIEFPIPYMGNKFYQKYTDKQVESTIALLKYLVEEFKIEIQPNLKDFFLPNPAVSKQNLPGIWSHTTVLAGKSDIIPQPNLLKGIYDTFLPKPKEVPKTPLVTDSPIK